MNMRWTGGDIRVLVVVVLMMMVLSGLCCGGKTQGRPRPCVTSYLLFVGFHQFGAAPYPGNGADMSSSRNDPLQVRSSTTPPP
jgi:hypothetical protein